jgi:hypothetical protein
MDRRIVKDITRDEWVAYEWIDATALGDQDRMYVRGLTRDPSEAIQAGLDHDAIMTAINNLESVS